MKLLDLTLDSPFANVALDEALLETAERNATGPDVLRIWESTSPIVVIGRSSIVAQEVNIDLCKLNAIPIVRRASGGAAIVTGPGCLMYAVVLNVARWPELAMLDTAHRMILQRTAKALNALGIDARQQGTSDLAVGDRKISGNSMRRKRDWVLYHGTLLYGLSANLIQQCLNHAPRQPAYRQNREHADFVSTMSVNGIELKNAIIEAWCVNEALRVWPEELTRQLVAERYEAEAWNFAR